MESYRILDVHIGGKHAGTLVPYRGTFVAFEYTESWLRDGYSINPFSLPLQKKRYIPKDDSCGGLFGVFADSLPDGWGLFLVDQILLRENVNPQKVDLLNRLAIVGDSGMGALTYFPSHGWHSTETLPEYDRIAEECSKILSSEPSGYLDELFLLGGSSGGAWPKILTKIDGEDWIVKFPASTDRRDVGETEYLYSLCAKKCGIDMTETRLFPSGQCPGYFGTKRFDRTKTEDGTVKRNHMLSVPALLEASHLTPDPDYHSLMRLTLELTKDYSEVEKMYRLMCFNVYAHNRDDHAKNFSFLYDEKRKAWKLAPAYDLTYSSSFGGEHAIRVNGNGSNPTKKDILAVAERIGLAKAKSKEIAEHVRQTVFEELGYSCM